MNMHCLVAVARCRVQTRRYHCLINHIQSHRLTLCRLPLLAAPFSPCSARFSPFSALAAPRAARTRRVIPQNFPRAFSLAVLSRSLSSPRFRLRSPLTRCSPLANRPQLTLIYVIFSGRPHVTALQCTLNQTCPMRVPEYAGMRLAGVTGGRGSERKGANEDKRGRRAESPNGHPRSPSGDIRNVNRTNQSGDELAAKLSGRARRFSHFTKDEGVPREHESEDPRRACYSIARDRCYEQM